jgi:hypothetical protein
MLLSPLILVAGKHLDISKICDIEFISQAMMLLVLFSRKKRVFLNLWPLLNSLSVVYSSIVGRPRHTGVMVGMGQKDSYVGYEILNGT